MDIEQYYNYNYDNDEERDYLSDSDEEFEIDYADDFEMHIDDETRDLMTQFKVEPEEVPVYGQHLTKEDLLMYLTKTFIDSCKDDEIFEVQFLLDSGILKTEHFVEYEGYAQNILFITAIYNYSANIINLLLEYDINIDNSFFDVDNTELFFEVDFKKHFFILEILLEKNMFGKLGEMLVKELWDDIDSPRHGRNDIVRILTIYGKLTYIKNPELNKAIKEQFERRNLKIIEGFTLFGVAGIIVDFLV